MRLRAAADRKRAAVNPDHHRPRAIVGTRRPDVQREAILVARHRRPTSIRPAAYRPRAAAASFVRRMPSLRARRSSAAAARARANAANRPAAGERNAAKDELAVGFFTFDLALPCFDDRHDTPSRQKMDSTKYGFMRVRVKSGVMARNLAPSTREGDAAWASSTASGIDYGFRRGHRSRFGACVRARRRGSCGGGCARAARGTDGRTGSRGGRQRTCVRLRRAFSRSGGEMRRRYACGVRPYRRRVQRRRHHAAG